MARMPLAAVRQAAAEDGWLDYVAAFGTLVAALVAIVAVVIAVRSARDSKRSAAAAEQSAAAARSTSKSMEESLAIARETSGHVIEQVRMQRAEHQAFLAEHARQPKLELRLRLHPDSEDGRVEKTRSTTTYRQLEVEVHNAGARTADNVGINVLAPEWLTIRWSYANGSEKPNADPPAPGDIRISDAAGVLHDTHYVYLLTDVQARISQVEWVRFAIPPNIESVPLVVGVSHDSLDEPLSEKYMVSAAFTD